MSRRQVFIKFSVAFSATNITLFYVVNVSQEKTFFREGEK